MIGRALPSPDSRAYRFALPGAGSKIWTGMPSRPSTGASRRGGPTGARGDRQAEESTPGVTHGSKLLWLDRSRLPPEAAVSRVHGDRCVGGDAFTPRPDRRGPRLPGPHDERLAVRVRLEHARVAEDARSEE